MRKATRPSPGARVVGTPGRSDRAGYRAALAAYRAVPTRWKATAAVLAVALAGAGAHSVGARPAVAMLTVVTVLAVGHFVQRHPAVAATLTVLAATAPLIAPAAAVYAYARADATPADLPGAAVVLAATLLLVAVLAHRTSRRRPWLTTLLAAAAVLLVGPMLLMAAPGFGFAAAWTLGGLVLFARGGGVAWLVDQYESLRETVTRRLPGATPPAHALTRRHGAVAQERTAAHLADLPAGYTVFHDVQVPGTRETVHHVVLGPSGVYVASSHRLPGVVSEHPDQGLLHDGQPLADLFADALYRRDQVSQVLRLPADQVQALVVLHEAKLPCDRSRVALFDREGQQVGDVVVLTGPLARDEIALGVAAYTPRRVTRLVRRANRVLVPSGARPVSGPAPDATRAPVTGVLVDADGRPREIAAPERPEPMFVSTSVDTVTRIGQPCTVLTTTGMFTGYRIAGDPAAGPDGVVTVALCTDAAWVQAERTGTDPVIYTRFPLASVQPETAAP